VEEAAEEAERATERCLDAEAAIEAAAAAAAAAARALRARPGEREEAVARLKALERLLRRHSVRDCDELLDAAARGTEALGGGDGSASRLAALEASAAAALDDCGRTGCATAAVHRRCRLQV
jgi:DNA repair ATPase RecN